MSYVRRFWLLMVSVHRVHRLLFSEVIALFKNALLKYKAAVSEFDKLRKEQVVLKKSYKDAQIILKAAETEVKTLNSNMAESARAFEGAQLSLRDKSRELDESEFEYERHTVTEHFKLGLD